MYLNGLDELDQKRPMSSVGDIPANKKCTSFLL